MLSVYIPHASTLERISVEPGSKVPENAVWIDMVTPTVQEDKIVEASKARFGMHPNWFKEKGLL